MLAIIEANADLDKVCIDGTALHAAANCGHEACVRMLIKEGAIVDLTSWEGDSPLFCACSNDYDAIITALLDANADPLIVDDDGYTAAHYGRALLPWITGKDGVKRRKSLLEQPRVPVPWSREGHAGFRKPRREQAVALVRAGAVLCRDVQPWRLPQRLERVHEGDVPAKVDPAPVVCRVRTLPARVAGSDGTLTIGPPNVVWAPKARTSLAKGSHIINGAALRARAEPREVNTSLLQTAF